MPVCGITVEGARHRLVVVRADAGGQVDPRRARGLRGCSRPVRDAPGPTSRPPSASINSARRDQRRPYCFPFSSRLMTAWSMPEYASNWRWVQPSETRRRLKVRPEQVVAMLSLRIARSLFEPGHPSTLAGRTYPPVGRALLMPHTGITRIDRHWRARNSSIRPMERPRRDSVVASSDGVSTRTDTNSDGRRRERRRPQWAAAEAVGRSAAARVTSRRSRRNVAPAPSVGSSSSSSPTGSRWSSSCRRSWRRASSGSSIRCCSACCSTRSSSVGTTRS